MKAVCFLGTIHLADKDKRELTHHREIGPLVHGWWAYQSVLILYYLSKHTLCILETLLLGIFPYRNHIVGPAHCRSVIMVGKLPNPQEATQRAVGPASSSRTRRVDLRSPGFPPGSNSHWFVSQGWQQRCRTRAGLLAGWRSHKPTKPQKAQNPVHIFTNYTSPPNSSSVPLLPLLVPIWDNLYHP